MSRIEAVPNVSEGRDEAVVAAIGAAYVSAGAKLVDTHRDVDHHRSVHTLFADQATLVEALVAGIRSAAELIDLRQQDGVHPRVGAADVVPLIGFDDAGREAARQGALAVGKRVGAELGLPVFLYGEVGQGRRPAFFRRGGPTELQRRLAAGELVPDFGPARLDPGAGAVIVGARAPLIAFNLVLTDAELALAEEVARAVRGSGGGMDGLQAIGLRLASTRAIQVSMNVIDVDRAPLHEAVALVRAEARARGADVGNGELVGLLPARVVARAAAAAGVDRPLDDRGVPTSAALEAAAVAFALPGLERDRIVERYLR
ncbi:MAG: glutamate formimidoyltransferase [Gaiellales bacterium]